MTTSLPGIPSTVQAGVIDFAGAAIPLVEPRRLDAASDPRGALWRAFTLDHDHGDAAAAFLRRYGQPPRYVFPSLGLLLVGPVPGLEGGA